MLQAQGKVCFIVQNVTLCQLTVFRVFQEFWPGRKFFKAAVEFMCSSGMSEDSFLIVKCQVTPNTAVDFVSPVSEHIRKCGCECTLRAKQRSDRLA